MKTVLVTGAGGFVGSRTLLEPLPFRLAGVTHRQLDITDPSACLDALAAIRPAAVFHAAAISRIDACREDPALSRRVNLDGAANLAAACQRWGARMIFCSTDQVYGGCGGDTPLTEETSPAPENVYAQHKLAAEAAVAERCESHVILRLSWMFDLPVRGLPTNGNLVTNALESLLRNRPMRLAADDRRAMTYVREVAENLPAMLEAPSGVYNYAAENDWSTYETMARVFALLGAADRADALLEPWRAGAGKGRNLSMNTARARAAGARFSSTLDGVARLLREYRVIE